MQQTPGITAALAVRTSVPTANGDGTSLSGWDSIGLGPASRREKFLGKLVVSGGSGTTYALYVNSAKGPDSASWGLPTDSNGNMGLLCSGVAFAAGVYFFEVADLVGFYEACLVRTSGTGTATATLTDIVESV